MCESGQCEFVLQDYPPHGHFTFFLRQVEAMVLTDAAPYPAERTLLTTGVLDAAMHSRWTGRGSPAPGA